MNNEEIKLILETIKNPTSEKTLFEEGRITDVNFQDNGELTFCFDRTSIDIENKKIILGQVHSELKGLIDESKIIIKTTSSGARQVNGDDSGTEKKSANLRTEHGQQMVKKRIQNVKNTIIVSSCKGGVGKSTFTVNYAKALQNQGFKVGIIDADIYGPSLPMLLGKRDAKPIANEKGLVKPIEAHGLKFISFGLFIKEEDPVIWRGPMLGGVLNQFFFEVDWGELDYLLLDLPPGTGDVQLTIMQNLEVDGAIILSTPQEIAILDTTKGLNMFKQIDIKVLGMIENMSYFKAPNSDEKYYIFGKDGVRKASEKIGVEFLGGIPLEIELRESSDKGVPYMSDNKYEGRPVWESYMDISQKVDKMLNINTRKSFFGKLFNK